MGKYFLIFFFICTLFSPQILGNTAGKNENAFPGAREKNILSYEINLDYLYLTGMLPSAQVYFNIVPEAQVSSPVFPKPKVQFTRPVPPKIKIIHNLTFQQISLFSRHCSAFVQIYLRSACFRL